MVRADNSEPVYVGRLGLTDSEGRRLLIDWRSPAAEPFFGATYANPMGLASRRRYRWTRGRISDYWDEVFTSDGVRRARRPRGPFCLYRQSGQQPVCPDAGRARHHPGRPRRHHPRGIPRRSCRRRRSGTGKTVVALHRSAYLLYSDPRLGHRGAHSKSSVLFIGPHRPYLNYVADVLPSLGEEGVQTCTLRNLLPEGAAAAIESRPGRGPPEVVRGHGESDRARSQVLRTAAHQGDGGRDALGRYLAERRRLGRGVRVTEPWHSAQRGAGRGLGGAAHNSRRQVRRR